MKSIFALLFLVGTTFVFAQTNIGWKDLIITETTTTTTLTDVEREVPKLNAVQEKIVVDLNMKKGTLTIPSDELVKISGILCFNEKDFNQRYFKLSDIKLIK